MSDNNCPKCETDKGVRRIFSWGDIGFELALLIASIIAYTQEYYLIALPTFFMILAVYFKKPNKMYCNTCSEIFFRRKSYKGA